MRNRRPLFLFIVLAYISLCVWWVSFIPYDVKSLYRAVPSNSVYISEHADLSGRWHDLSANPLIAGLLEEFMNVSPEDLERLRNEPMAARLFDRFAGRNTMVSYTELLPGSGRPALVIASWAGSSGQVARWSGASGMLGRFLEKSGGIRLGRIDFDKGSRAWLWEPAGKAAGYKISAGFAEGVLVCCISPDPEAVCHVLRSILNHEPMGSILQKHYSVNADDGCLDRGWVRLPNFPGVISFGFSTEDDSRTEGWINIPAGDSMAALRQDVQYKTVLQESGLNKLIGDVPGVFCALRLAGSKPMLSGVGKIIYSQLDKMASQDAMAFMALLGGDYSGHLMVRVPTLIVGVQVPENTLLPERDVISDMLDNLNKKVKTSFIPVYEEYNGKQMLVIGGTADDFYGSLEHDDKSSVAVFDKWLVYSSNKGVMKKLIDGVSGANGSLRWLESVPEEACGGYGWMDLDSADSAIESGIVAYSLMLSLEGGAGTRSTRRKLDAVRGLLRRIAPLQSCRMLFKMHESNLEMRFILGKETE